MISLTHYVGVVAVVFSASSAFACSESKYADLFKAFTPDIRVTQAADCSFQNGGRWDNWGGGASEDIGNHRVIQRFPDGSIGVWDCATGESARLFSDEAASVCGSVSYFLSEIVKPDGPLDLRAGKNLSDFAKIAEKYGASTEPDINKLNGSEKPRNRVNYACGCKLFYPDSVGATQ